jgi:hypothetical protein
MINRPAVCVAGMFALLWAAGFIACAETITVGGRPIPDAELEGVSETGAQYKTPEGLVTVPWAELNGFQKAAVHTRFMEPLENLRSRAVWVEGSVFEVTRDGVVVQISLDLKGGNEEASAEKVEKTTEWKNGAEVIKGMIMVKDMKDSRVKKSGDPVAGIYFKTGRTFTYEVGGFNLIKELPVLTEKKPEWLGERDWSNRDGKKLKARLVAVRDGKCLLHSNGKSFPYEIAQLSDADQALIAEYLKNIRVIPVP